MRRDIEFKTDENLTLRGWFYAANVKSRMDKPSACIIMTHGFTALKEHYLDKFANEFAKAGLSVLVYDHRNFGDSEGDMRYEVDPIAQVQDMTHAISYAQQLKEVDPNQIGLWGTSLSGGVVIAVAAKDSRVKAVVSQVPFVSGHHKYLQKYKPAVWHTIKQDYEADRTARLKGNPPKMIAVVSETPDGEGLMKTPSAYTFFTSTTHWKNNVTLRSIENCGEFEPISSIQYDRPMPILLIVADNDTINATELALKAYRKARDPKNIVMIEGDHFSPYVEQFDICAKSAIEWFHVHLGS